jgi:Flp pilus assembly protein TadB
MNADQLDEEAPEQEPARPRAAPWKYLAAALLLCVLAGVFFGFMLLVVAVAVVVLAAGVLFWFLYWWLFSRRGTLRRLVRYRRMEARRHERWLRRAAEREPGKEIDLR